jgi:hypothetical protein
VASLHKSGFKRKKGDVMVANDIEGKIIEFLKNNSDVFHESQVKPIVYAVYGGEKINNKNISSLLREIYSVLCKLENDGIVKNTNRLPKETSQSIAASRWVLSKQ